MPRRRIATIAAISMPIVAVVDASPARAASAAANNTQTQRELGMERVAILGDRLGGFVLPVTPIPSNLVLAGARAWVWQVDDTQRVELRDNVQIQFGSYSFSTSQAFVWINRLPTEDGDINQIAIYFPRVEEPTSRAGFGARGDDVLVTASSFGNVTLRVSNLVQAPCPPSQELARGQARLGEYLQTLVANTDAGTQRLSALPQVAIPQPPPQRPLVPGEPIEPPAPAGPQLPGSIARPIPSVGGPLIVQPDGIVNFAAKSIEIDEAADTITVLGQVAIEYEWDRPEGPRRLELRAERAVAFLMPGTVRSLRRGAFDVEAGNVEGIYLEGGVIGTDGVYTIRGERVYYDFLANRATIADAILRTYTRESGTVPIYARAKEMRQVSSTEFRASNADLSTSEFFTPHLSIGVERVTITEPPPGVSLPPEVAATGLALKVGGTSVLPLPDYRGRAEPQPFRGFDTGYQQDQGAEILTRWDLFQLFGIEPPAGLDSELLAGGYTSRGPAIGTEFKLDRGLAQGELELFGLYDFGGTDRTSSGLDVEKDASPRGIIDGAFQTSLSTDASIQAQLAYISDQTFVSAWRTEDFTNRREYETSAYLNWQSQNTALTVLGKYGLNGFLSNSYLLASRSYQVDKIPEAIYQRVADDIFDGLLWTQSWSATLMNMRVTKGSPNSLGIPAAAFGPIGADESIRSAYEAAGFLDDFVTRVYTRHELSYPFGADSWTLAPFVFLSAAGYLEDHFQAYSPDADNFRFLGGGGVRGSARFVHIDDAAENRFFDIHRIRHIIEPNMTLWYGYDSLPTGSLPIYDQSIEGASGGTVAQLGVRQQWQTQRGGAGAWESVNFLTIDVGAVVNDGADDFQQSDAQNAFQIAQSPLPSFYTWRPELSQWGSNVYGMGAWQISDTLTLAGTGAYLLDDRDGVTNPDAILRNLAKGSVGLEMRHSPDVSTYVEYRYVAPTSSELVQFGVLYQVGRKYLLSFSPQYDVQAGDLRRIQGSLTRTFPDFNLLFSAGYDLIEDQTSVSLSLRIPADGGGSPNWTGFTTDARGP